MAQQVRCGACIFCKDEVYLLKGVYRTQCDILKVTNEQLRIWKSRFAELEGIDIHDAAAVATASLAQAVEAGLVNTDEVIMLNITGGGEERAKSENDIVYAKPHLVLDHEKMSGQDIIEAVEKLFD